MRDYWLVQYLLAAVGWTYIIVVLIATALALKLPKRKQAKVWATVVVIGLSAILPLQGYQGYRKEQQEAQVYKARLDKAQALFAERCKTAGEKIYRTVERVEGIKLVNPRPQQVQGVDEVDQNWQSAGMSKESTGEQYILNFLFYDVPAEGQTIRQLSAGGTEGPYGSIAAGVVPKGIKGYQYVETEEGGERVEYSLRNLTAAIPPGPFVPLGKRELAKRPSPTYAVVYENIADPEGRANWIAGARIKVMDHRSGELLGDLIQFSFEAGFGSAAGFRQPWAFARQCPSPDPSTSVEGTVRFFAQKILKPIQGK